MRFGATFKGDRRIVGFYLTFGVPEPSWKIASEFRAALAASTEAQWPAIESRFTALQKNWESERLVYEWLYDEYDMERLISFLRAGGNPFTRFDDGLVGEPGRRAPRGTVETKAFMNAFRAAIGAEDGWHLRVAPLLIDDAIASLRAKTKIDLATPKPKQPRKSMKERTDIM